MNIFSPKIKYFKYSTLLFCFFGFLFSKEATAQTDFTLHPDIFYRIEPQVLKYYDNHVVIKPVALDIKSKLVLTDSIFSKNRDLYFHERKKFIFRLNPILQSSYRFGNGLFQHQALGFQSEGQIGKNLTFEISYAAHLLSRKPFENTRLDSANLVYGYGRSYRMNDALYLFHDFRVRLIYSPNRFLTFSIGQDKEFFGDGYHSLFLSDNAPSFPFFRTTLHLWNIKYVNQVMVLNDYKIDGKYNNRLRKYAAMHILSWNVTKRLNFNAFEAVIWRMDDSVGHQRLDINYLNPFLIYRPQEYTLGSPDNVLLGIGSRYRISENTYLYGQFLLDEFLLKEILIGRGWWANKDALQLGMKSFKFFNCNNLYFQLEYNQSRPFTFGHEYPLQNYGYLLQPLAHPLGTNFREFLVIVRYAKKQWQLSSFFSFSKYGLEPGGKTVGADIYQSSDDNNRLYPNEGNYIGQGIGVNEYVQKLKLSRIINPRWGLVVEAGFENSMVLSTTNKQFTYFTFGLKTLLSREDKLF